MKKRVLVTSTNYSLYCGEAKKLLEDNGFEVLENKVGRPHTFEELKELVPDLDAVVAGVDTWNEDVFCIAHKLKIIARFGVGVDNIDLKKAKEYGVAVTNARGLNANAVAEQAVAFMLAMLRQIPHLDASVRKGEWERFVGRSLSNNKVGLLGFGAIPQHVAKKLSGFDVQMYAFDKYPNEAIAKELNVTLCSMEEILNMCDIVSLHLPGLPELHHVMNEKTFSMMKDGAYFINTARGTLVDEKALIAALESGKLAMAATDVYENEPAASDNPLFQMENVICSPHTAAETFDTYRNVSLTGAKAIVDYFEGKTPANLLNG